MSLEQFVRRKISSIMKHCIITNSELMIQCASDDILGLLSFSLEQLYGKHIAYLTNCPEDLIGLTANENARFMHRQHFVFSDKWNHPIDFVVEVFNTKVLTPSLDLYVFRLSEGNFTKSAPPLPSEIDQFVYNMSHDLRGPLATMQGLIGLLKMKDLHATSDQLISLIEGQTHVLEKRLFDLAHLAKNEIRQHQRHAIPVSHIRDRAEQMLSVSSAPGIFSFEADAHEITGIDIPTFIDLVDNVILFFNHISPGSTSRRISLRIQLRPHAIFFDVEVNGITIDPALASRMYLDEFVFSAVIRHPILLHFYAASRIAKRLNGRLLPSCDPPHGIRIACLIPIK